MQLSFSVWYIISCDSFWWMARVTVQLYSELTSLLRWYQLTGGRRANSDSIGEMSVLGDYFPICIFHNRPQNFSWGKRCKADNIWYIVSGTELGHLKMRKLFSKATGRCMNHWSFLEHTDWMACTRCVGFTHWTPGHSIHWNAMQYLTIWLSRVLVELLHAIHTSEISSLSGTRLGN